MQTLLRLSSNVEVYSIDEAFADLSGFTHHNLREYALEMRRTVKQWTGIPVSIGPGPTKTLAKIASRADKKADGVLLLKRFTDHQGGAGVANDLARCQASEGKRGRVPTALEQEVATEPRRIVGRCGLPAFVNEALQ